MDLENSSGCIYDKMECGTKLRGKLNKAVKISCFSLNCDVWELDAPKYQLSVAATEHSIL